MRSLYISGSVIYALPSPPFLSPTSDCTLSRSLLSFGEPSLLYLSFSLVLYHGSFPLTRKLSDLGEEREDVPVELAAPSPDREGPSRARSLRLFVPCAFSLSTLRLRV